MHFTQLSSRLLSATSWSDCLPVLLVALALWGVRLAPKGNFFDTPLNKGQGQALRGFFACVVVLNHIVGAALESGGGVLAYRLSAWGLLSVSVFFGLSGWGLSVQAGENAGYADVFWQKRLQALAWPYLFLSFLSLMQIVRGDVVLTERLRLQLGSVIGTGWFVHVLLIFYLIFWWCIRDRKTTLAETTVRAISLVLAVTVFQSCLRLGNGVTYGAFVVGLLLGAFRQVSVRWLKEHLLPLLLFSATIAAMHLVWLLYLHCIVPPGQSLARFLMYTFFFAGIAAVSMKVQLGNRALVWLGTISYELYLCHGWVMTELRHWWPELSGDGFVYAVVAGSLAMASALHGGIAAIKRKTAIVRNTGD